jgi:hypothetical protein
MLADVNVHPCAVSHRDLVLALATTANEQKGA